MIKRSRKVEGRDTASGVYSTGQEASPPIEQKRATDQSDGFRLARGEAFTLQKPLAREYPNRVSCFLAWCSHASILTLKLGDLAFKISGLLTLLKEEEKGEGEGGGGEEKKGKGIRPGSHPTRQRRVRCEDPSSMDKCVSSERYGFATRTPDKGEIAM